MTEEAMNKPVWFREWVEALETTKGQTVCTSLSLCEGYLADKGTDSLYLEARKRVAVRLALSGRHS